MAVDCQSPDRIMQQQSGTWPGAVLENIIVSMFVINNYYNNNYNNHPYYQEILAPTSSPG